jgi:hypothetical protein
MHVEAGLRDDAIGIVELGQPGEMRDVAGVNEEGRLHRRCLDLVDRFLKRADGVGIGRLVEADMAVADLQERQPARLLCGPCLADEANRSRNAARNRPQHAGAGPGHALEDLTPADALRFVVIGCHRQSPSQPQWLAGARSGSARFIPGVSPESFFR